jgi:nucleotide-binding universal stress UspA family protein
VLALLEAANVEAQLVFADSRAHAEETKLKELIHTHVPPGVRCEGTIRVGDPAQTILATADVLGVDLIVMATHGREGLSRLVLGSVAENVIRGSKRPGWRYDQS